MEIELKLIASPSELNEINEELLNIIKKSDKRSYNLTVKHNPLIYEACEKLSHESLYLCYVILRDFGGAKEHGYYIEVEDLDKYGITEKNASARVGGTRRVCKRLGLDKNAILSIRKKRKDGEKRFYLNANYSYTVEKYLEENQDFKYSV